MQEMELNKKKLSRLSAQVECKKNVTDRPKQPNVYLTFFKEQFHILDLDSDSSHSIVITPTSNRLETTTTLKVKQ